jgi:hydroxyethylthiazole kinase-like uncharacterized protein yjeF
MLIISDGRPVLTPAAMRAAEAAAIAAGCPALTLMERAATAAAAAIRQFAPPQPVLVLCGPGNNGGDGYGVAVALQAAGWPVSVAADAMPRSEPAATMAARWTGPVLPLASAAPAPLVVDALFGTGLVRPLDAASQAALDRLRGAALVVAVDIASGLDAGTGTMLGRPLPADLTISFGAAKPGHLIGEGPGLTGRLVVADIGVPVASTITEAQPPRRIALGRDTHKYARGWVLVVGGQSRHGGATGLTALSALRSGAGAVTLVGRSAPALAIMLRTDAEAMAQLDDPRLGCVAVGPGMRPDGRGRIWLARLRAGKIPLVIDAGGLDLLDAGPVGPPAVLTPHAGEFARLFGPVGDDPLAAVAAAAARIQAVVLLKGPATIIAAPDGRIAINSHATPWLATAGSGDVLTGIIAALVAQGLPLFEAAQVGAWLHGDAGLRLGPGLIADDLVATLPAVLAGLPS